MDVPYKDTLYLYFIKCNVGPIMIGLSVDPRGVLTQAQFFHYDRLTLLSQRPGDQVDLSKIRQDLSPHSLGGAWYVAAARVMDVVHDRVTVPDKPYRPGPRLDARQVVEIFRLCHETSQTHEAIGRAYGVSRIAVGRIARGQSYPHLFRRSEPFDARIGLAPGVDLVAVHGEDFYVSENRDDAPQYRMAVGRRGVR